jgi:hypothetical protein
LRRDRGKMGEVCWAEGGGPPRQFRILIVAA